MRSLPRSLPQKVGLLAEGQEQPGIFVHHGFYEGARQHADAIVSVIQQRNREVGRALPVWVSGHSLGGAYANCIMLHLLSNRKTTHLFTAGNSLLCFCCRASICRMHESTHELPCRSVQ